MDNQVLYSLILLLDKKGFDFDKNSARDLLESLHELSILCRCDRDFMNELKEILEDI